MTEPSQDKGSQRVYFVSLGCAKNQVDTEVMLGVVQQEGLVLVDDPKDADTLVVNTCGFIEAAKEESIDTILEMAQIKAAAGDKKLVVAGCLRQRYADALPAEMPEVDHFLGSADMLGLRSILRGEGKRLGISALSRRAYLYDHTSPRQTYGSRHSAFVKIAEGCDRPCAFCIIPKLRGPQRSRTIYSLVEEAHQLSSNGVREISLVAQDLTLYGTDLPERGMAPANLEQLLDALGEIDGLDWIRLHYAYPTAVSDGLIRRIAEHPRVATYIDVPVQHVDTGVLKKMRRGYTEKVVRDLVDRLRAAKGRIWIRTTLLVGHPGETEEAYRRLHDFVAEGQLDHVGVFPWSREEGTVSAMQPSRVNEKLSNERAAAIIELQAGIRLAKHLAMVGKELEVMIDGESDESDLLLDARHEGQAPDVDGKVIVCDGTAAPGTIVRTRVLKASAHALVASMDLDRNPDGDD